MKTSPETDRYDLASRNPKSTRHSLRKSEGSLVRAAAKSARSAIAASLISAFAATGRTRTKSRLTTTRTLARPRIWSGTGCQIFN